MEEVVLVIHLILALSIIGLVLIQRSEGGGLGIGGGGGLGGLASPQGTANALSRITGICAGAFFCTSLLLGIMAGRHTQSSQSIFEALKEAPPAVTQMIDTPEEGAAEIPAETPSAPTAE